MDLLDRLRRRRLAAAGIALLVGFVGAVVSLVYGWPHTLGRIWFWLWFAVALYYTGRHVYDWARNRMRELEAEAGALEAPSPTLEENQPEGVAALQQTHGPTGPQHV